MIEGTLIGPPMGRLLSTDAVLYGLNSSDSKIYQYQGTPNQWTAVGEPAMQFITNANNLYRLEGNGDVSIFQGMNIDEAQWLKVDENMFCHQWHTPFWHLFRPGKHV